MKDQLFTIQQYADLHEIGRRTLHFYDEIGLFSPVIKKENGYRYYSLSQGATLEMILTLRELDMSLEEIKHYIGRRNPEDFEYLLQSKQKQVDDKIKSLRGIKSLLNIKQEQMGYLKEDMNSVRVVTCRQKNYLMTETNEQKESYVDAMIRHGKALPHHLFNMELGTANHTDNLYRGKYNHTNCIFSNMGTMKGNFVREAGSYIRAFQVGDFDDLTRTYRKIVDYCKKNQLKLEGYAFETGINDLCVMCLEEYITMIEVKVKA